MTKRVAHNLVGQNAGMPRAREPQQSLGTTGCVVHGVLHDRHHRMLRTPALGTNLSPRIHSIDSLLSLWQYAVYD